MRIGLIVMLSWLLVACTPSYNWREVSLADGAVIAVFPDKPLTQERPLNYSGHELRFSLTTATVDDTLFAVGYAPLPDALRGPAGKPQELASSVVASLYQNMGVKPPEQTPELGKPFTIEGASPQGPMRMRATVWLTDHALIEGIVMSGQRAFPQQEADEFLRSLVVAR